MQEAFPGRKRELSMASYRYSWIASTPGRSCISRKNPRPKDELPQGQRRGAASARKIQDPRTDCQRSNKTRTHMKRRRNSSQRIPGFQKYSLTEPEESAFSRGVFVIFRTVIGKRSTPTGTTRLRIGKTSPHGRVVERKVDAQQQASKPEAKLTASCSVNTLPVATKPPHLSLPE